MSSVKKQKILFIITNCSVEPLGIMYLSAILKNEGHIVDLHRYKSKKDLYSSIRKFNPDEVCLSMTTGQHLAMLEIARAVKDYDKNIKIIAGGPHVTYFPDIVKEASIDYIIRGEADHALLILINSISAGKSLKGKDKSILTLPSDLDFIPFPDRSIAYKYQDYFKNPVKNIMTSRGCPFSCSYCYNSAYRGLYKHQRIVRYRSPENIIEECKQLIEDYPVKMIFFADDEFSTDIERLKKLKNIYIKEIKLPFHCQVRIDFLDEKRVKTLKEMGCYSLTFAIESGNEEIRKKVLNRNVTNNQIIEGCRLLKKYGIKFRAENMIGLPNETFKNVLETLDLNIVVKPDYAWVSLYQPYPKTSLGDYCIEKGLFDGNLDAIKENFTDETAMKMPKEYKNQLINMQRLFSLIVEFPFMRHFLWILLMPNNKSLYSMIRDRWKKYCYWKRLFIGGKK